MISIEWVYLGLFIACLSASAFFSSSETAFTSLRRVRLEQMINEKVPKSALVAKLMEHPARLLSTILTGNNLVNTAAAALGTALAVAAWGEWGVLISTVGVTIILLVFCEATPKVIAAHHPEKMVLRTAGTIAAASKAFTPAVLALSAVTTRFSKIAGGATVPRSIVSEEDIRTMISMGHKEGTVEEDEAEMLHKVFEFGDRPVREVMVPRPEVVALEKGSTVADFLATYVKDPISRFPLYQENMDNVIGTLAIKDVLMGLAKGSIDKQSIIDDLSRPPYFTPEGKHINDLFSEMQARNYRMAVVVDEYGGTAGVVTISRLVEEIVGEFGDELAEVEKDYEAINEYTFQVDGGMRIEEANEEMELELPEGDYETVAGFVLDLLGHIPKRGEQLKYKGIKIVITKMRGVKIEEILLTKEKARQDVPPAN